MEHTKHTLLVGVKATTFAISTGLAGPTNLSSPESIEKRTNWRQNHRQPNFWKNVVPVGTCGPYHPIKGVVEETQRHICQGWFQSDNLLGPVNSHLKFVNQHNHDTISMAVIDELSSSREHATRDGSLRMLPWMPYQELPISSRILLVLYLRSTRKDCMPGRAMHGWTFQYSVRNSSMQDVEVITVEP